MLWASHSADSQPSWTPMGDYGLTLWAVLSNTIITKTPTERIHFGRKVFVPPLHFQTFAGSGSSEAVPTWKMSQHDRKTAYYTKFTAHKTASVSFTNILLYPNTGSETWDTLSPWKSLSTMFSGEYFDLYVSYTTCALHGRIFIHFMVYHLNKKNFIPLFLVEQFVMAKPQ